MLVGQDQQLTNQHTSTLDLLLAGPHATRLLTLSLLDQVRGRAFLSGDCLVPPCRKAVGRSWKPSTRGGDCANWPLVAAQRRQDTQMSCYQHCTTVVVSLNASSFTESWWSAGSTLLLMRRPAHGTSPELVLKVRGLIYAHSPREGLASSPQPRRSSYR